MKTTNDFMYWLSGVLEYTDPRRLSKHELEDLLIGVKQHLALVTDKVTDGTLINGGTKKDVTLTDEGKTASEKIKEETGVTVSKDIEEIIREAIRKKNVEDGNDPNRNRQIGHPWISPLQPYVSPYPYKPYDGLPPYDRIIC